MTCPKCGKSNVILVGNTHYICNDPDCSADNGNKVQFNFVIDEKIRFPYNQIFKNRNISEFYRKPYLQIKNVGVESVNR
jgi:hypothetical protein